MAQGIVHANGTVTDIAVAVGEKIIIGSYGSDEAQVYYQSGPNSNALDQYYLQQSVSNEEVVLGTFAAIRYVRIEAGADDIYYNVGTEPTLTAPGPSAFSGTQQIVQGAPTAKTVDATLTGAELLTGIITVNQGAAGTSTQTLPLATAMDTAFPGSGIGYAFDFSVINISTTDAEDATIATNTGWTLVGNMEVQAASALTLNTSGRFRARKTAAGAWTLYRMS